MEKPSTQVGSEADATAQTGRPEPRCRHPYTLNDLPLYQVKRKARYARRSRHNALVVAIATVRGGDYYG